MEKAEILQQGACAWGPSAWMEVGREGVGGRGQGEGAGTGQFSVWQQQSDRESREPCEELGAGEVAEESPRSWGVYRWSRFVPPRL